MSLMKTLGRVAIGVAMAKGVSTMMKKRSGSGSGGGLGDLLGGALGGGNRQQQGSGGLGDLGSLLGGRSDAGSASAGGLPGGLGGLLESIAGGNNSADSNKPSGGVGAQEPASGSLGDLLNSALRGDKPEPEPAQEAQAQILIEAMINAAKSDGQIDQSEQEKIVENLGDDITEDEKRMVVDMMQSPLDVNGFVGRVPRGSEMQVYMMSLLGIDLDTQAEAQYLDQLRRGLRITEAQANQVHQRVGAPTLYS
ncbi:MAG: protein YebE [Gammaproteobacteria bacterium]|nr:MAG: protein YebE [Gammaproteobacteria bacterium]